MVDRAEFWEGVSRLRFQGRRRRRSRRDGCGGGEKLEPRGAQGSTGEILWVVLVILLVLAHTTSWAAGSPPGQQQPAEATAHAESTHAESTFGAIAPYL